jgi:hypothetical protein
MPIAPSAVRDRREAVVREHMASENRHEFDVTMATFDHPRYELIATGEVHDGEAEVAEPEGEGIVCERVYFDLATILRQLEIAAP